MGLCDILKAMRKHYVDAETIEYFLQQTADFTVKKNAIYFPYDKVLPVETLTNTVKQCFQNKEEARK